MFRILGFVVDTVLHKTCVGCCSDEGRARGLDSPCAHGGRHVRAALQRHRPHGPLPPLRELRSFAEWGLQGDLTCVLSVPVVQGRAVFRLPVTSSHSRKCCCINPAHSRHFRWEYWKFRITEQIPPWLIIAWSLTIQIMKSAQNLPVWGSYACLYKYITRTSAVWILDWWAMHLQKINNFENFNAVACKNPYKNNYKHLKAILIL